MGDSSRMVREPMAGINCSRAPLEHGEGVFCPLPSTGHVDLTYLVWALTNLVMRPHLFQSWI